LQNRGFFNKCSFVIKKQAVGIKAGFVGIRKKNKCYENGILEEGVCR